MVAKERLAWYERVCIMCGGGPTNAPCYSDVAEGHFWSRMDWLEHRIEALESLLEERFISDQGIIPFKPKKPQKQQRQKRKGGIPT